MKTRRHFLIHFVALSLTASVLPCWAISSDAQGDNETRTRLGQLEEQVEHLQRQLNSIAISQLDARWRLVAAKNAPAKARFRVGSLLEIRADATFLLDRVPGDLDASIDGNLTFTFDDDFYSAQASFLGDYLKLEGPDGVTYIFVKIPEERRRNRMAAGMGTAA